MCALVKLNLSSALISHLSHTHLASCTRKCIVHFACGFFCVCCLVLTLMFLLLAAAVVCMFVVNFMVVFSVTLPMKSVSTQLGLYYFGYVNKRMMTIPSCMLFCCVLVLVLVCSMCLSMVVCVYVTMCIKLILISFFLLSSSACLYGFEAFNEEKQQIQIPNAYNNRFKTINGNNEKSSFVRV